MWLYCDRETFKRSYVPPGSDLYGKIQVKGWISINFESLDSDILPVRTTINFEGFGQPCSSFLSQLAEEISSVFTVDFVDLADFFSEMASWAACRASEKLFR